MRCAVNMVPYFHNCLTTVRHHALIALLHSSGGGGSGGCGSDYSHF